MLPSPGPGRNRCPQVGPAAIMPGMAEDRTSTRPAMRTLFAILALLSTTVAVAAIVLQIWLTAIGSSLTAIAMVGFFWNTRPRRAG